MDAQHAARQNGINYNIFIIYGVVYVNNIFDIFVRCQTSKFVIKMIQVLFGN